MGYPHGDGWETRGGGFQVTLVCMFNQMPGQRPDQRRNQRRGQPVELVLQEGVLTRAQAMELGLTDKAIAARIGSGRWQRLSRGVYASFSGKLPRPAQLWAGVLSAGPGAMLSHLTAAELYELSGPSRQVHVLVPSGSRVSGAPGVVIHYSRRAAAARHPVQLPPRTRIEETILDLYHTAASVAEAIDWIFRGCGSRRTTADRIGAAADLRGRLRWRAELLGALDLGQEGVHSILEFRYVAWVERPHGLPAGTRQRVVRRGSARQYADVGYDDYDLLVELDGRLAHPQETRGRDIRRDNANIADGRATLRYSWADIAESSCEVAAEVAEALRLRGWTGELQRCGPSCRAASLTADPARSRSRSRSA